MSWHSYWLLTFKVSFISSFWLCWGFIWNSGSNLWTKRLIVETLRGIITRKAIAPFQYKRFVIRTTYSHSCRLNARVILTIQWSFRFLRSASNCKKKRRSVYWIAGDEAYVCTEQLITPFPATRSKVDSAADRFKFYLSSHRIHIEQAFGILLSRWGLLWKPLQFSLAQNV